MYYYERAGFDGKWWPCVSPQAPVLTRDGRERCSDSTGRRVRAVSPLGKGHEKLTLDQLAEVYSPDGLFYATARAGT